MIAGRNRYSLSLLLTFILLLASCRSDIVFTDSLVMPQEKWSAMNISSFSVPVTDTIHSNDVSFTIRTSSSYPFRNIYLFVTTTSPDGKSIKDTLQYYLADEKGKWLGRGFGDIHELTLPYKSNVYFPLKGTYIFKIQQGMRNEELKGIYDFGLRIVRISN